MITGLGPIVLASTVISWLGKKDEEKEKEQQGEQPALQTSSPNVLLVTIDTIRADHLGIYGYQAPADAEETFSTTPNIDAFVESRGGAVFEQAIAVAPYTQPTHATILTGLYPATHGVRTNQWGKGSATFKYLPEENYTMAEILRDNGYTTAAVIAGDILGSEFNFDQGFDTYEDLIPGFPNNMHQGEKFASQVT